MLPLLFIVNGEDVPLLTSLEETLAEACDEALKVSKNTGRSLDQWEVRKETGELIDTSCLVSELGLQSQERLFVTLRIGAGG